MNASTRTPGRGPQQGTSCIDWRVAGTYSLCSPQDEVAFRTWTCCWMNALTQIKIQRPSDRGPQHGTAWISWTDAGRKDSKGYICATQKHVIEVAIACRGLLVVPRTKKEDLVAHV